MNKKNILKNSLVLALLFSVVACKKDDGKIEEPKKEPTQSELIMSNVWKITSFKAGDFDIWNTPFVETCQKDNTLEFKSNDILLVDDGPLKCSEDDPQVVEGKWAIPAKDKLFLEINLLGLPYSDTAAIISLSPTTMVVSALVNNLAGQITFSKVQ
jgi:hypothetical protein